VKLVRLRRPKKVICSPSYLYYRPKINAVILLVTGHTLRGDCTREGEGKGRKPKLDYVDGLTIEE
jgi:hypothetical protein